MIKLRINATIEIRLPDSYRIKYDDNTIQGCNNTELLRELRRLYKEQLIGTNIQSIVIEV